MDYYQTHDEIDEIGEGLIRKYQYQSFIQGTPTDIEDFITSNLGYRIVYDRIAEGDAGKMAFLADGKTALLLWRNGQRVSIVPPKGLIIVDEYLRQEQNHRKRRFVLAHEAGHILMDRLGNNPVTSAFSREFDTEKQYTVKELADMFSIAESMATAMGVALLMPRTSIVRYVRSRGYEKRIPLYGDSVLCTCDRNVVRDAANQFQVSYKSMFLMRGYTKRKDIMAITVPELLEMGVDKPRMKAVSELMKAVRNGDSFLAFLVDENSTNTADIEEGETVMEEYPSDEA